MARLNDPPGAFESVDALKRRFVRQNRELARINSNQSVRIRSLETEISRLLTENIAYRERVIKLQHEVGSGSAREAKDSIEALRSSLRLKLTDLTVLVEELGEVQGLLEPRRAPRRKSIQHTSPRTSLDQEKSKSALSWSQVTGTTDGRLPPIVEDKCYPRRTMESDEIRNILDSDDAMDSPDLGPPPVVSWETTDSVQPQCSSISPLRERDRENVESNILPSPANLETRRKRRESTHHMVSGRSTPKELHAIQPVKLDESSTHSLKAGAKRKVNVREGVTRQNVIKSSGKEVSLLDYKVEKPDPATKEMKTGAKNHVAIFDTSHDQAVKAEKACGEEPDAKPNITDKPRQALGEKSVNTDPLLSPAKTSRASALERMSAKKTTVNGNVVNNRNPRNERPLSRKQFPPNGKHEAGQRQVQVEQGKEIVNTSPKKRATPSLSLTSPPLSNPSAARSEPRGTPPPPDLNVGGGTLNAAGASARVSRRSRGSVSYAEPSLRDKMRRPTKELVDAVVTDDRAQITKVREKGPRSESTQNVFKSVAVKQEASEEDRDWRTLPSANSIESRISVFDEDQMDPLSGKTVAESPKEISSTILPNRSSGDSAMNNIERSEESMRSVSNAGSTIATLVSWTQKPKKSEQGNEKSMNGTGDIFELHSSSPTEMAATSAGAIRKGSRRHSSTSGIGEFRKATTGVNESGFRGRERKKESSRPGTGGAQGSRGRNR